MLNCVVQLLTGLSGLQLHKNNLMTAAMISEVSDVPGMCHKMTSLQGIYSSFYSQQTEDQTDEVSSPGSTAGQWSGRDPCSFLCATHCHLESRGWRCSSVRRGREFSCGPHALGGWELIVLNAEEEGGLDHSLGDG